MKFGFKQIFSQTPNILRVAGKSIFAACAAAGGICTLNGENRVGTYLIVVGVLAKFVTEFFGDDIFKTTETKVVNSTDLKTNPDLNADVGDKIILTKEATVEDKPITNE